MNSGIADVAEGLSRWRLWTSLAWEEFRARYHKTFIGPIWLTVSFLAFIAVKVFIFGALNTGDGDYFVSYLTIGFMVWTYITNAINGGCAALVLSRNWILGIRSPYSIFVLKNLCESAISLFFVSISALVIAYFYTPFRPIDGMWACIGAIVLLVSLFWWQLLFSVICIFARDLIQLVSTFMRIAFFLTPIIWIPESIGIRSEFVYYNPFSHFIALVRAPLLGEGIPLDSYIIVAVLTGFAFFASLFALSIGKKHIALYI
jgi:ABC-type polysaccharide/polyol phosphate export permease